MWTRLPGLDELRLDFKLGRASVVINGERTMLPGDSCGDSDHVDAATFVVARNVLVFETCWGDRLELEMHLPGRTEEQRAGRPAVYLDQNKWIDLARARHRPELLSAAELAAAQKLIALMQAGEVILPLAGAHWLETMAVYGPRREQLASTMAELSRGWLVRNAVAVRVLELAEILAEIRGVPSPVSGPVVTLDPYAWATDLEFAPEPQGDALELQLSAWTATMAQTSAIFEVLVGDPEPRSQAGVEAAEGWASGRQAQAEFLRSDTQARAHLEGITLKIFIDDIFREVEKAASVSGLSDEALVALAEPLLTRLLSKPYLAITRQMELRRLRNAEARWTANDLIDLHYLSCAAAYTEHVVCERRTAADLRAVARVAPVRAQIHTKLAEVVDALT